MDRSLFTLDLTALRHNVARLREVLGRSELWAVVKADAYGHGADDVARVVLESGAAALCVATIGEGVALRERQRGARIIVLGPSHTDDARAARASALELTITVAGQTVDDLPVHLKLDTGMGRWGLAELPPVANNVVGLMSHFATADSDPAFARAQLEQFLAATERYAGAIPRHMANSAGVLALPEAHLDAARCGIALYGISPFGDAIEQYGLRPVLQWESVVADVKLLRAGDSTGYGRRFVATEDTWIALVPVGYADGFRRDMTGTDVVVGGVRRPVVGTVSMDTIAVSLGGEVERGTSVMLIGGGVTVEEHAQVAGTIGYEITCGLTTGRPRARREIADA